jgi:hypothetical protein
MRSFLCFASAAVGRPRRRALRNPVRHLLSPKDDPEHGVRVGFVADVDGRLIEVVQMLAA